MKNRTIDIILVVLVLGIFISYFAIKNTMWHQFNAIKKIDQIELYAKNGQWNQAKQIAIELHHDWKKKKLLTIINYGEAEFSYFEESLNFIIAGTETKDLSTVLSYAKISKDLWVNFNKVVPEP